LYIKEHIVERSLLNVTSVVNVLVKQELLQVIKEDTLERNLSDVISVVNVSELEAL